MIFPKSYPFLGILVYFILLDISLFSGPCATLQVLTQLYMKMRSSCQFSQGIQIGKSMSSSLPFCAAFCQFHSCQSFEFGCSDAPSTGLCKLVCRIYKNVPPRLDDDFFEGRTKNDYYEVVFPLPPQNYGICGGGKTCVPGAFCGKVVRRKESGGLYTVAVLTVCYSITLNASEALDWNLSKQACSSRGGKLIELTNFEEQMLVVKLMNRMASHPNYVQAAAPSSIWMGCNGRLKDWKWLDGSNVTTFFWHGTNPDSTREVNCCATLYSDANSKTFWMDRYCLDKTARMCVFELYSLHG